MIVKKFFPPYAIGTPMEEKGGNAQTFESDLTSNESIQQLFGAAESEFGPVNISLNKAKYGEKEITETYSLRRVEYPEDITNVILFLASKQAKVLSDKQLY